MNSNVAHFRDRYRHAWKKIAWHVPDDLKHGRFVDIGCGIGSGLAAAVAHGAELAVGIDRSMEEFSADFALTDFPLLCRAVGMSPERTLFIEGDLSGLNFPGEMFDYALMLDSAEHVPDPAAFFAWAYRALRPGGCFVVDTCPLFYSPVGHHLWSWFPAETDPWAHLRPDFAERCAALGVTEWHMERFHELNRATHGDLRRAFIAAGFEITQEHRSGPTEPMRELFERYGPALDLRQIEPRWLFQDWILLVGQK